MIDVELFPGETDEELARRVSLILAVDATPEPPPYRKDNGGFTLDRSNNWWLHDNRPGSLSVRVSYRYGWTEKGQALEAVLRDIDGRKVEWAGRP